MSLEEEVAARPAGSAHSTAAQIRPQLATCERNHPTLRMVRISGCVGSQSRLKQQLIK